MRALARDLAARRRRRRLRPHRLVPGPLRHARRLPPRRAQRRHRQPRPPRRRRVRPPADRARRRRRAGRPGHLRPALALRRLPRRDRRHAGVADAARDRDAGRAADARPLRLRRQPGAVGARRRRARARARAARPLVSLDLYVNETNRHADYVLPATTFLERDDVPLAFLGFYTTPFVQYTDPVVEPAGEARDEWA